RARSRQRRGPYRSCLGGALARTPAPPALKGGGPVNLDPPPPAGLLLYQLTPGQIETVLAEVFTRGVRCGLLDHPPPGAPARAGAPQWLLAELGDGRITGACPQRRWRRSDPEAAAWSASAPGPKD